jgi:hypothetical protein
MNFKKINNSPFERKVKNPERQKAGITLHQLAPAKVILPGPFHKTRKEVR